MSVLNRIYTYFLKKKKGKFEGEVEGFTIVSLGLLGEFSDVNGGFAI